MKHAKPYSSERGNVPRGPARWERAALNAVRHPNTRAAQLYRHRVALAVQLSEAFPLKDRPFEFLEPLTYWSEETRAYGGKLPRHLMKRMYATCSTYCTVMQIQLDFGARNLAEIGTCFRDGRYSRQVLGLDTATLVRELHCFVCDSVIKKTR